jgi:hypothetical protein
MVLESEKGIFRDRDRNKACALRVLFCHILRMVCINGLLVIVLGMLMQAVAAGELTVWSTLAQDILGLKIRYLRCYTSYYHCQRSEIHTPSVAQQSAVAVKQMYQLPHHAWRTLLWAYIPRKIPIF